MRVDAAVHGRQRRDTRVRQPDEDGMSGASGAAKADVMEATGRELVKKEDEQYMLRVGVRFEKKDGEAGRGNRTGKQESSPHQHASSIGPRGGQGEAVPQVAFCSE